MSVGSWPIRSQPNSKLPTCCQFSSDWPISFSPLRSPWVEDTSRSLLCSDSYWLLGMFITVLLRTYVDRLRTWVCIVMVPMYVMFFSLLRLFALSLKKRRRHPTVSCPTISLHKRESNIKNKIWDCVLCVSPKSATCNPPSAKEETTSSVNMC